MAKVKLAEALLRRKELSERTDGLKRLQTSELFEVKAQRVKITDNIDDLVLKVPKLEANQVMAEYNFYARQLRLVDAAIQQANWVTEVDVGNSVMEEYKKPE